MATQSEEGNLVNGGTQETKVEINAANQQADKIINVGVVHGNINITQEKKEVKPTNQQLCKKLIEGIRSYSPKANSFLEHIEMDDALIANWEKQDSYLTKSKSILISSFSSVLGDFLSKLIACGNQQDYFEVSLTTTKRTLQLLCFAFVSSLWDQSKDKKYELNPDQLKQIKRFFNAMVEPDISFYAEFYKILVGVFQEQHLNYPFDEIKNMEADFKGDNSFLNCCKTIDAYRKKFGEDQSLPSTDEIENAITTFLVSLSFLANYKMASVKDIGYESVRNNAAQFLHAYTQLGVNNSKNSNGKKYNYHDSPISTDAVLLFKDKYQQGLNLFPFIIDINTLRNEQEVKICFYASNDDSEKILTFFDMSKMPSETNNDADVVIEFNKAFEAIEKDITEINQSADRDVTELKADTAKYQQLKMYEVYKTFQEAKSALLVSANS